MEPRVPSDEAARFAEAFSRWRALNDRLETVPNSVTTEEIAAAWRAVIEAHDQWKLSR
jgi:hypothetical protein